MATCAWAEAQVGREKVPVEPGATNGEPVGGRSRPGKESVVRVAAPLGAARAPRERANGAFGPPLTRSTRPPRDWRRRLLLGVEHRRPTRDREHDELQLHAGRSSRRPPAHEPGSGCRSHLRGRRRRSRPLPGGQRVRAGGPRADSGPVRARGRVGLARGRRSDRSPCPSGYTRSVIASMASGSHHGRGRLGRAARTSSSPGPRRAPAPRACSSRGGSGDSVTAPVGPSATSSHPLDIFDHAAWRTASQRRQTIWRHRRITPASRRREEAILRHQRRRTAARTARGDARLQAWTTRVT